jgi:hypothetical protein
MMRDCLLICVDMRVAYVVEVSIGIENPANAEEKRTKKMAKTRMLNGDINN